MLDPDDQLFPDARHIERHAIAFAQMMFAHAAFEREVRDLQGSIIDDPTFGERLRQWDGRSRPKRMVALIRSRLGDDLEETALVAKVLCDAIEPCDKRNLLAHGQWWCFNRRTSVIKVRGGRRWDDNPPEQVEYTAPDIEALVEAFKNLEAGLFNLRRRIERRRDAARVRILACLLLRAATG